MLVVGSMALRVTDVDAQLEFWTRALGLQADQQDADYNVMEDPEGNRFCVIDAAGWSGWDRQT